MTIYMKSEKMRILVKNWLMRLAHCPYLLNFDPAEVVVHGVLMFHLGVAVLPPQLSKHIMLIMIQLLHLVATVGA